MFIYIELDKLPHLVYINNKMIINFLNNKTLNKPITVAIVVILAGILLHQVYPENSKDVNTITNINAQTTGSIITSNQSGGSNTVNNIMLEAGKQPEIVDKKVVFLNDTRTVSGSRFQSTFYVYVNNPLNTKLRIDPKLNQVNKIEHLETIPEPFFKNEQSLIRYLVVIETDKKINSINDIIFNLSY